MKPRLLCVDDEPNVLEGLKHVLRRHVDVTTATSGSEGLHRVVEEGPFAVVLSDFAMPGMNGAQFLGHVRHAAPDTVRLLLTGQATLDDTIAAVNDGNIFRFLKKPCAPPDLIRALEDAVEQARLITADRRLIERKLEAMASHLVRAERLASLGTMAGAVGHELRNMLMVLSGTMSCVEEDAARGVPPNAEDLARLRQVQERLTSHARHLLNFGRSARDGDAATVDLAGSLAEVLEMMRSAGMLRQVRVRFDSAQESALVKYSRSAIEHILVNLMKNAVEAFAGIDRSEPTIQISLRRTSSASIVCTVADNGCGIAASTLALVFEPYYTTKPADRGTGLGLFVVRDIVRGAGGEVTVQSELGRGTTFSVEMPVAA
jgi:C4-dicarboxylate-specific signal transduction histidine kinase